MIKSTMNLIDGTLLFLKATAADILKIFKSPRETLKQFYGVSFYRNAAYLVVNSGATLFVGFIFNIVIARLYSTSDVGYGTALLSVAALLCYFGTLGFGYSIVRYLPTANDKIRLLNSFFTIAGLATVVACFIFLGGLSWWSPKLLFVRQDPVFFAAFVIFVTVATLHTVTAQVFVSFRGSGYVLSQGIIFSVLKLVLVVVLSSFFSVFAIFASQGIALTISLGICLLVFLPRVLPGYRPIPSIRWQTNRELMSFSFANYASEGFLSLPIWVLSITILNTSGAEASAYFYMAWTMSTLLLAIALGISASLFAEGSNEARNVSQNLVRSAKLIVLIIVPAIIILVIFGDKFLLAYGRAYSIEGTRLFQLFTLAALPTSFNIIYLGLARIEKWLKSLLLISGAMAVFTVVASYLLLPYLGIIGVGISWLGIQTALLFVTIPKLVRKTRTTDPASE
jgi:O-antigen/teichoic acid export membrane protein